MTENTIKNSPFNLKMDSWSSLALYFAKKRTYPALKPKLKMDNIDIVEDTVW